MGRFHVPDGWSVQAYKFALDPTPTQIRAIESHCGAARFAFNYMLAHVKAVADQRSAERTYGISGPRLTPTQDWSLAGLRRTWNAHKDIAAPWWRENSKEAYNSGLEGLARGLEAWKRSQAHDRAGRAVGFPRFKSKHCFRKSVRYTTGAIRVEPDCHHVVLPRLGRIHTHESTRKLMRRLDAGTARVLSATVSKRGHRWYCSFQVVVACKTRPATARLTRSVVGVDVGVRDLVVVATPNGDEVMRVKAPRPLTAAAAKLRALERRAARQQGPRDKQTGARRSPSNRWRRTRERVARTHARIVDIRAHELNKVTSVLARGHDVVVIERLNLAGMRRSGGAHKRGLNRAIGDAGMAGIRDRLAYKTVWNGGTLVEAPYWFPSTQTCSRCGAKTKLTLRERTYHCSNGCPPIDRDLNAAINLACLGDPPGEGKGTGTGSSSAASVTAGDGRGANQKTSLVVTAAGLAGGDEASTLHSFVGLADKTRTVSS
jgi:putative transposase